MVREKFVSQKLSGKLGSLWPNGNRGLPVGAFMSMACMFLFGCAPSVAPPPVPVATEPGLQLFPSPRDFDGPGQVISIDRDGVWVPVIDLGADLQLPPPRAEEIPAVVRNTRNTSNMLVRFAFLDGGGETVRDRRVEYSLESFGTRRDRIQQADLRALLNANIDRLQPEIEEGKEYFIIQETIWADSVSIILTSEAADSLSADAGFQAVLNASGDVAFSDSLNLRLVKRFQQPLRVFYKPFRLVSRRVRGGFVLDLEPVRDELVVTDSRENRR